MSRTQRGPKARLGELIDFAKGLGIEVRTETFLREVGYHVHSGSCRLGGKKLIILDRDLPVGEQVHLLADAVSSSLPDPSALPPHLRSLP